MGIMPKFGLSPSPLVMSAVNQTLRTQRTIRAISGYGTSSVDVTGGALCSITDFRKDFDDTNITALDFAEVTANLITLSRPGYYLVTYHTALIIALTQATTVNPATTVGKTILKAGGVELTGTAGYVTMTEYPKLDGFLKVDGVDDFLVQSDLSAGNTSSAEGCGGGGCFNALTGGTIDGTSNATKVETVDTESNVIGSTSGTAILTVRYNTSNVLKLYIGTTPYDPTVGVHGSRDSGTVDVLALSTSISIIKLF